MISVVLLTKIIGGICLMMSWVFMLFNIRRMRRELVCLREAYDERLTAMAEAVAAMGDTDEPDDNSLAEAKRKALEAERRFTEGVASILNFNAPLSGEQTSGCEMTGKKGE
jgi:hypothetical protein